MRRSPETLIALTWLKQRKLGVRNIVRGCIPAALSTRSPAPAVGRPAGGRRGWPGGAGFLKPSLRGPVPSHHRPHLRQLAGREYHRAVAARPRSGSARWPRAAARRARFHPPSMIAADGVASGNGGWPLAAHGLMYGTTGPGRHPSGGSTPSRRSAVLHRWSAMTWIIHRPRMPHIRSAEQTPPEAQCHRLRAVVGAHLGLPYW